MVNHFIPIIDFRYSFVINVANIAFYLLIDKDYELLVINADSMAILFEASS